MQEELEAIRKMIWFNTALLFLIGAGVVCIFLVLVLDKIIYQGVAVLLALFVITGVWYNVNRRIKTHL